MTPAQVIAEFRTAADDLHEPYLWVDTELLGYLDHAQNEFVRFIEGFADTAIVRVSPRQEYIRLPDSLLKIRDIKDVTHDRKVTRVSSENASLPGDSYRRNYTGGGIELIVGEKEDCLVFSTLPTTSFDLKILYFRLPCDPIRTVKSKLEVKEQHHVTLLKHVLYQAYSKQDSDAHDPRLAGKYFTEFQVEAAKAREEKGRLEHVPRTVRYGGL